MNAAPSSAAGTGAASGASPQTSFTPSAIRYASPNVSSNSSRWPLALTRLSSVRSHSAPSAPTASGAATSATQKLVRAAIA